MLRIQNVDRYPLADKRIAVQKSGPRGNGECSPRIVEMRRRPHFEDALTCGEDFLIYFVVSEGH